MEKNFNSILVNKKEVAEDTYEVTFEIDNNRFSFLPGQYVWVVLPELQYPDERGNRRPFSVVSRFKGKHNQVSSVFRKSDSGFKRTLINMPIGSAVRIEGPFGFCTLPQDETIPVVFLVGGVGIASVFTMINHATVNKSPRRIILIYVNSNPERATYLNELGNIQTENKNFTLISRFGDLTSDLIFSNTKSVIDPVWYIFGPEDMVFTAGEILIKHNIQPGKIETEEFRLVTSPFFKESQEIIEASDGFKMALDNAYNHIVITDLNGIIRYANRGAKIITGYSIKEMLGNTPRLWGGLMSDDFYKSLWKTIKEDGKMFEGELTNRKKSGDIYIARVRIYPFFNPKNNNLIGFVGTEEDITKEKEVEKLRMDFLSLASHQLRTPLSGIKWLIGTLNREVLGSVTEKQKEYLNQIYQINERMIKLVFDMLNALRFESGEALVKKETISIPSLYEEVSLMTASAAKNRGVELHNVLENHTEVVVETDIAMLSSILETFISNAINYSERGQEIFLDAKEEPAAAVFFVKDSGIGIPKEEQGKIFEKFYRSSNAKAFKPDGTGLGLYTASLLAQKIGAKIWFESEINKGTTFYLRVPKKVEIINSPIKSKINA